MAFAKAYDSKSGEEIGVELFFNDDENRSSDSISNNNSCNKLKEAMKDFGDDFDINNPKQVFNKWNYYADQTQKILLRIKEVQSNNRSANDHRSQRNSDAVKKINDLMKEYESHQFVTNLLYQQLNKSWQEHGIDLEHQRILLNNKLDPEMVEFIDSMFDSINKNVKKYSDQADELKKTKSDLENSLADVNKKLWNKKIIIIILSLVALISMLWSFQVIMKKPPTIVKTVIKHIEKPVTIPQNPLPKLVIDPVMDDALRSSYKFNVSIPQQLLFESAQVQVKDANILFEAVLKMNGNSQLVLVDGHTDSTPLRTGGNLHKVYGSNGGLSKARAQNVAMAVSKKFPKKIIAYIGRGAQRPIIIHFGAKWGNIDFQASRRVELSQFNDQYKKITGKSDTDIVKDLLKEGYVVLKDGVAISKF